MVLISNQKTSTKNHHWTLALNRHLMKLMIWKRFISVSNMINLLVFDRILSPHYLTHAIRTVNSLPLNMYLISINRKYESSFVDDHWFIFIILTYSLKWIQWDYEWSMVNSFAGIISNTLLLIRMKVDGGCLK